MRLTKEKLLHYMQTSLDDSTITAAVRDGVGPHVIDTMLQELAEVLNTVPALYFSLIHAALRGLGAASKDVTVVESFDTFGVYHNGTTVAKLRMRVSEGEPELGVDLYLWLSDVSIDAMNKLGELGEYAKVAKQA